MVRISMYFQDSIHVCVAFYMYVARSLKLQALSSGRFHIPPEGKSPAQVRLAALTSDPAQPDTSQGQVSETTPPIGDSTHSNISNWPEEDRLVDSIAQPSEEIYTK